jgi:hypothetical protein
MDAELYKEAIEYELLTQSIYNEIMAKEGVANVDVQHNISIQGRSGAEHQIDVYWEFKQAGITHRVLIECKNYASSLTLEKARNFFGVLHDIGSCVGIMVTKTGYQAGAAKFCKHYGIALKLLRKPKEEDWEGRIKEIHIKMIPKVPVSTEEHPIVCQLFLRPNSNEQEVRLNHAVKTRPDVLHPSPFMRFLGRDGEPVTDELRMWLPRQLDVLKHEDGGPYKKSVELNDRYVSIDLGSGDELVQVIGIVIEYYVETLKSYELIINAGNIVSAILKDFDSGEVEHVHRNIPSS